MGRGRRGPLDQSERKQKATGGLRGRRGDPMGHFLSIQNTEIEKIPVSEQALEIMKNMDPKQLAYFLLPNDDDESDWYIKTSAANAFGN